VAETVSLILIGAHRLREDELARRSSQHAYTLAIKERESIVKGTHREVGEWEFTISKVER